MRKMLAWLFLLLAPACSLQPSLDESPTIIHVVTVGAPLSLHQSFGSFIHSSPGVKQGELLTCIRVRIPAISRLQNMHKYADSFRVKVEAAKQIIIQSLPKVDVCFHWNESLKLGQCAKGNWHSLEKGSWNSLMSPFETRLLDIRIRDSISDVPLTITVDDEFLPVRLFLLGLGLMLLLVAPTVSSWVPFYYSSGMALGVLLIILILLYQGMKLLPTGRKSTLYIVLYGSLVGMGTMLLHYFMTLVSSLLKEIGINDEAYNPVVMFLLMGVVLMGAWLGYWGVRKLVLSDDGTVDTGTAQFVKWAIRILGCAMILQSSHDPILAVPALLTGVTLIWTIRKVSYSNICLICGCLSLRRCTDLWKNLIKADSYNIPKVEFLSKDDAKLSRSPNGLIYGHPIPFRTPQGTSAASTVGEEYYSSFHKTATKKPMSQAQWTAVTQHFTKEAMQDLVSTPKFSDWLTANADRIAILPHEHREERSIKEIEATAHMPQLNMDNKKLRFWKFGVFIVA